MTLEDGMGYNEPPRLYQPVRLCLGAVLLLRGDSRGAEKVHDSPPL